MADKTITNDASIPPHQKRKIDDTSTAIDDTKAVQREAKVVEIVPEGDVTLNVGTGAKAMDIKVSGVVLSLA